MPEAKKRQQPAESAKHDIAPGVTKRIEQKQVEERIAIGAHVVHETIRREGGDELKRTSSALVRPCRRTSMGFSLVAEGLLAAHLSHPGGRSADRLDGWHRYPHHVI